MFELSEEHRMLQDLVAKFIDRDVIPLEKAVLAREMSGQKSSLSAEEEATLLGKCRELGLWGLDVPEEFGGANLPTVALIGVYEEQGRTCVPFTFPPDSPNLHMLMAVVQSGTTQEIPGTLRTRRGAVSDRHLRARRRRRSRRHDHPRGEGRRRLGDQRPQDLGQPRAAGRLHHRHGAHRRGQAPRRRHRLHRRARHQGIQHRARNPDARRPAHLRTDLRRLPHPRGRRCSARSARASRRCSCA